MDCSYIRDLFSSYLEMDLDSDSARLFESHLLECAACNRDWRYFSKTVKLLHTMEQAPAPPGMVAAIHAKLEEEAASPFRRFLNWFLHTDFSVPLPTATAIVAVAFTSMAVVSHYRAADRGEQAQQAQPSAPSVAAAVSAERTRPMPSSREKQEIVPVSTGGGRHASTDALFSNQSNDVAHSGLAHGLQELHNPTPDIVATLPSSSGDDHARLCELLARSDSWQTHVYNNDILLYVDPAHFNELRSLLAAHGAEYSPEGTGDAVYGVPKKLLRVAVRMK